MYASDAPVSVSNFKKKLRKFKVLNFSRKPRFILAVDGFSTAPEIVMLNWNFCLYI